MLIPHGKAYFYRILNKFQPKIEKLIFKLSKAYTYFPFYVVNTREQKVLNNSETVMKYIFKPESYFFIIIFNYFFYLLFGWVQGGEQFTTTIHSRVFPTLKTWKIKYILKPYLQWILIFGRTLHLFIKQHVYLFLSTSLNV